MMRPFLLFFFMGLNFFAFSQIKGINRGPCFKKSVDRIGDKYAKWECNNRDNIVDCNRALKTEPGTDLIFDRENGNPFTGDCESCHRNGIRERLVHFSGGKVDGIDTTYYESGCPQVVRNHIDGSENGKWTFYRDTSGLAAWHINYFNGKKHGKSIYFIPKITGETKYEFYVKGVKRFVPYNTYENDTLKIENYTHGVLNGVKKEYGPDSKLVREVHYKNGIFDGAYIEYDLEGNVMQERSYVEGKKNGEWKFYYNDGNLLRTESWDMDVEEGAFKSFYIQGHIQKQENYRKGEKHGEFIERFPDDKLKVQAFYKKGELLEKHVFDKYGNEIETIGGDGPKANTEDDELPSVKSKKW